jgi:rRNA maturation endonuclease Nob1
MSDDDKENEERVTQIPKGKDPLDQVANSLMEAKKKAKTEDYKKAVIEVEKAQDVFASAVEKAADIAADIANLEKKDMRQLFKAVGV